VDQPRRGALLNQRVCKITLTTRHFEPGLLDLLLPGYLQAIRELTSSVTVTHLSSRDIAEIPLPLPPLAEQKRIVAKVEELLTRVNAARERLAKAPVILKRFRQSVLAAACSGDLTSDWRLTNESQDAHPEAEALERERFSLWCASARAKARAHGRTLEGISWQSRYERPREIGAVDTLPEIPESWRWASFDSFAASFQYGPRFGEDEYVTRGGFRPD
jgi:type I restriction enzyme, S subunit